MAGFVFNALLIARAPLQLFQAIQGSLLPHLAGLEATEGRDEFRRAIRITLLAIAAFAGTVALGLLLLGPFAMEHPVRRRLDLRALRARRGRLGMGAHLAAGTLNQAALARDRAGAAATAWMISAVAFLAWMLSASSTTSSRAPRSATSAPRACCSRCSPSSIRGQCAIPRRPPKRPPRAGAQLSPWPETLTMPGMTHRL